MADTLFDELQKKLAQPGAIAPSSQQSTIASTLAAKSGTAAPTTSTAPRASNVGEQVANDSAATEMGKVNTAGVLEGAQIGAQAQAQTQATQTATAGLASQRDIAKTQLATQAQGAAENTAATQAAGLQATDFNEAQKVEVITNAASNQFKALASEYNTTTDNIFREFERSQKDLAFRKDAAQLEQVGFVMALQDKQYLDEINRVGAERDLEDKLSYSEEMQRLVMGDQLNNALDETDFKRALGASQREWDMKLANIDLETALAFSRATIVDEQRNLEFSGIGQTAKGGIDAYYKYNPTKTTTEGPREDSSNVDYDTATANSDAASTS